MIRLDQLTVRYRRQPALHHISGRFAKGSLTAVCGPNGAGKSTLLKSLLGLVPVEGRIELACERSRIAYLPQQSEIDRSLPVSVLDCVLLGFWPARGALGGLQAADLERAQAALQATGLAGFARRPVGTLSSGQFQRALFARLLVQDADLILLDEPFTAIDSRTCSALMQLVKGWEQQGRTVVAVVHDDQLVRDFFPQCLLLARQTVDWGETREVMTPDKLQRARDLAEAWDHSAPTGEVAREPYPLSQGASVAIHGLPSACTATPQQDEAQHLAAGRIDRQIDRRSAGAA